jgi:hypothetical protein
MKFDSHRNRSVKVINDMKSTNFMKLFIANNFQSMENRKPTDKSFKKLKQSRLLFVRNLIIKDIELNSYEIMFCSVITENMLSNEYMSKLWII